MTDFEMRKPCVCGCEDGVIRTKSGQDCVHCSKCLKWQYNAPKTETGRAVRSVQTVHEAIKPQTRSKVLLRSNSHCELCGKSSEIRPLHVGHLISVDSALPAGLTDDEINSLENLAAMCDECNLGLGSEPVPLRFAIMLFKRRNEYLRGQK